MSNQLVRQTRYQLPPVAPILMNMSPEEEKEWDESDEAYFRHLEEDDMRSDEEDTEELESDEEEEEESDEEDEDEEDEENGDKEECPICFKHYNDSTRQRYTITSCQLEHPLCRKCAIRIAKTARQRREEPRCPICRKNFRGIENKENKTFSFGENKRRDFNKLGTFYLDKNGNIKNKTQKSTNYFKENVPVFSLDFSKNDSFGFYKKSKRTRPSSKILSRRSRNRSPRKTVSRSYKTNKK